MIERAHPASICGKSPWGERTDAAWHAALRCQGHLVLSEVDETSLGRGDSAEIGMWKTEKGPRREAETPALKGGPLPG